MSRTVTISEERYRELLAIEDKYSNEESSIQRIFDTISTVYYSDISWEDKYRLIFEAKLCRRFREHAPGFSWYDPDASYEDDVRAFYWAAEEYMTAKEYVESLQ